MCADFQTDTVESELPRESGSAAPPSVNPENVSVPLGGKHGHRVSLLKASNVC